MGFLNSFVSYLLLLVIFVVLGGCAIALGIMLRKKKNSAMTIESAAKEETAE